MARIRTIKPELFKHYDLWLAEKESGFPLRVAFEGLWCVADREGRFKWCPPQLKIEILPYDEFDFSRVLDALTTRGFVVRYRVNDEDYGYIPTFKKHQVINNRERASELPEPNKNNVLTREPRVTTREPREEHACHKEGKGTSKDAAPPARNGFDEEQTEDHSLFARGKKVLGNDAGGLIAKLKKVYAGNVALTRAAIETASTKEHPRQYVGAIIRGNKDGKEDGTSGLCTIPLES